MESGVIPPPKRAPRSLVAPPKVLPKEHYSSPKISGPATNASFSSNAYPNSQVADSGASSDDQRRLQLTLKEEQRKIDRLLRNQTQLEEELVHRTELAEKANIELKQLRQKRQNTESDLAQTTADFMNCQAKWLQQAEEFSEEIQALKMKLSTAQKTLESQAKELNSVKERESERKKGQKSDSKHPVDMAEKAEQIEFQNRVYIEEAKQLNSKLKRELAEQRNINERLVVSNEEYKDTIDQYQFLLIEKTVTGDLNQPISLMSDELTGFSTDPLSPASLDAVKNASISDKNTPSEFGLASNEPVSKSTRTTIDEAVDKTGDKVSNESLNGSIDDTATESINETLANETASTQQSTSEELAAIRQRIRHQEFELKSLHNHNRALKVSLENLVGRLLENKGFHRIVEETLSPEMVQSFCARVSNQISRPSSVSSATGVVFDQVSSNRTGKRVFSLGVDNELPPPICRSEPTSANRNNLDIVPLRRQSSISPITSEFDPKSRRQSSVNSDHLRSASTYPSDLRPSSGSGPKIVAPAHLGNSADGGETFISLTEFESRKVAPRVESMSGLRKLRLKD